MFDYLYYRLYRACLKSSLNGIPEFIAPIWLAGVISINIIVLYTFLVKIDILHNIITNSKECGAFCFIMMCVFGIIYRKKKRKEVIEKYSIESESDRKKGNVIVSIYVIISFLLIFAVAFFRPGKL
jgi:amino acid transporter